MIWGVLENRPFLRSQEGIVEQGSEPLRNDLGTAELYFGSSFGPVGAKSRFGRVSAPGLGATLRQGSCPCMQARHQELEQTQH